MRIISTKTIANWVLPISKNQFSELAAQFERAVTYTYGEKCETLIEARKVSKCDTMSFAEALSGRVGIRLPQISVIETSSNADDLTKESWGKATDVLVKIGPVGGIEKRDCISFRFDNEGLRRKVEIMAPVQVKSVLDFLSSTNEKRNFNSSVMASVPRKIKALYF